MEGKTVMLSVFIMSLVIAQVQVEATLCCPNKKTADIYATCRTSGVSKYMCERLSGCENVSGTCPGGYTNDILQNSGDGFSEYCKLGCVSSVCGAISTLQNSDASEIVKGAVDQCTEACSVVCNKGSMTAIKTA